MVPQFPVPEVVCLEAAQVSLNGMTFFHIAIPKELYHCQTCMVISELCFSMNTIKIQFRFFHHIM